MKRRSLTLSARTIEVMQYLDDRQVGLLVRALGCIRSGQPLPALDQATSIALHFCRPKPRTAPVVSDRSADVGSRPAATTANDPCHVPAAPDLPAAPDVSDAIDDVGSRPGATTTPDLVPTKDIKDIKDSKDPKLPEAPSSRPSPRLYLRLRPGSKLRRVAVAPRGRRKCPQKQKRFRT